MANYAGLVIEMLGKPRHIRNSGQVRISLSTENVFQHPDRLAKILLEKVRIAPVGEITTDGRKAQFVLPISVFGGLTPTKGNVEENLLTWLGSAKLALTEEELAQVYGEKKYVITAHSDRSLVQEATVTKVDEGRIEAKFRDGRRVVHIWTRKLDEHNEIDQATGRFWSMLAQHAQPEDFTQDLQVGDKIEVAEIHYGGLYAMDKKIHRADCWRFLSH